MFLIASFLSNRLYFLLYNLVMFHFIKLLLSISFNAFSIIFLIVDWLNPYVNEYIGIILPVLFLFPLYQILVMPFQLHLFFIFTFPYNLYVFPLLKTVFKYGWLYHII